MNIIIPAAGAGQRFKDAGYELPKPFIPVHNKEILFHVLDNLSYNENDTIFILYNNELSSFDTIINEKYPHVITVNIEKKTKGAAETLFWGISKIKSMYEYNKKCLVIDCDTFYTENIVEKFRENEHNAVFYTVNTDKLPIYSYIKMNGKNEILEIKEKVKISDNANTGAYGFADIEELYEFSKVIVENNICFQNEPYTSCVIDKMIQEKKIFEGIELTKDFVHILGTPKQVTEFIESRFAFLFDLDGTLIISDSIYFSVWTQILKNYKVTLTEEIFKTCIQGNSDETVMKNFLPFTDVDIQTISNQKDIYFQNNLNQIKIISGSVDFIKFVKKCGHLTAVVTNCNRVTAEKILEKMGIDSMIDHLVIGSECKRSKPFPDPYLKACELVGIKQTNVIIFEDSKSGLLSARTISPKCLVGITTVYDEGLLRNQGVNIVIDDYENLCMNSLCSYSSNTVDHLKTWMKDSLKNLNIESITIKDEKLKGGFIADIIQVKIFTEKQEVYHCVLKLENKNETNLSIMAKSLELYQREYYFYENISKYLQTQISQILRIGEKR